MGCTPQSCLSACREIRGCSPRSGISACREGRCCSPRSWFSPCREGMACIPRSVVSACRGGMGCTPRTSIFTCRWDIPCTSCSSFSASREGRRCTPRSSGSTSLRAVGALRAGAFQPSVGTWTTHCVVSFQLAVRAPLPSHYHRTITASCVSACVAPLVLKSHDMRYFQNEIFSEGYDLHEPPTSQPPARSTRAR